LQKNENLKENDSQQEMKVVHPDWLRSSCNEGKKLPEDKFLILKEQSCKTIDSFFDRKPSLEKKPKRYEADKGQVGTVQLETDTGPVLSKRNLRKGEIEESGFGSNEPTTTRKRCSTSPDNQPPDAARPGLEPPQRLKATSSYRTSSAQSVPRPHSGKLPRKQVDRSSLQSFSPNKSFVDQFPPAHFHTYD